MKYIQIKITTASPSWPLIRQTPNHSGKWGNCQFYVDDPSITECDYWVVHGGLTQTETVRCDPKHTLFIATEPPDVHRYSPSFLSQFAHVMTCDTKSVHKSVQYTYPAVQWMIGGRYDITTKKLLDLTKDYDELTAIKQVKKTKLLSVISSNKTKTPGHRLRLSFVEALKNHFGDKIDVFGSGINTIADKWDAIAPYKYHIVIENSSIPYYWTEKIIDAYLAMSFPLYYGCINISDYFPLQSFQEINIQKADKAIKTIEECLKNDRYMESVDHVVKAKDLCLNTYNIFPMITQWLLTTDHDINNTPAEVTLSPEQPPIKINLFTNLTSYLKGFMQ